MRSNLPAQTLFPLRAKNDHADFLFARLANRAAESFRNLGKPFRQPAFGPSVGRTWIDPDDDIRCGQSTLRESPHHCLVFLRKDDEFRCRWIACETCLLYTSPSP